MKLQDLINAVPEDKRNLELHIQFHSDKDYLFYVDEVRVIDFDIKTARPNCVVATIGKPRKIT